MNEKQLENFVSASMTAIATGLGLPAPGLVALTTSPTVQRAFSTWFLPDATERAVRQMRAALAGWVNSGELHADIAEWAVRAGAEHVITCPIEVRQAVNCRLNPVLMADQVLKNSTTEDLDASEERALQIVVREYYRVALSTMGAESHRELQTIVLAELLEQVEVVRNLSINSRDQAHQQAALRLRRAVDESLRHGIVLDPTADKRPFVGAAPETVIGPLETSWFDRLASHAREIVSGLRIRSPEPTIVDTLRTISVPTAYSLGLRRLRDFPFDDARSLLKSINETLDELDPQMPEKVRQISLAYRALRLLENEAGAPAFECVAGLVGSWGAGKTRMLADRMTKSAESGSVSLLTTPNSQGIKYSIYQAASEAFGVPINSAHDLFDSRLRPHASLTIVVDGIDQHLGQRRAGSEFMDLVDRSGEYPNVEWIVTVDARRLWIPFGAIPPEWWQRHHSRRRTHTKTISGWISLDDHNSATTPGRKILGNSTGTYPSPAPHAPNSASYVLRDPLPAWLVVENSLRADVPEFRQTAVIDAYWRSRLESLDAIYSTGTIDRAISLIARSMADDARVSFDAARVARVAAQQGGVDAGQTFLDAVRMFEASGLLQLDTDHRTYAVPGGLADPWAKKIAEVIRDDMGSVSRLLARTAAYLRRARRTNSDMASAVGHFVLLLDDWTEPLTAERLCNKWYQSKELDNHALWSAAVVSPLPAQQALAANAAERPLAPVDAAEIYLMLCFAENALFDAMDMSHRLILLRRLYMLVHDQGLHMYLLRVHRKIVSTDEAREGTELREILQLLEGAEPTGVGQALAANVVGSAAIAPGPLSLLPTVLGWLEGSREHPWKFEREANDSPVLGDRPVWAHVVDAALARLAQQYGVEMWPLLSEGGWLSSDLHERVSRTVASQIRNSVHVSFGHLYNAGDSADFDAVIGALIEGCATDESKVIQRQRAYFILRHTTSIPPKGPPRLDVALLPSVEVLAVDAELTGALGQRYANELQRVWEDLRRR